MARPTIDLDVAGRAWARRTRAEQELEPRVTDPVALRQVANLILTSEADDRRRGSEVA